jgi:putative glutamine amidotransferase
VSAPTIGISTEVEANGFLSLRPEYVRAVEKAGGVPFLLPVTDAKRVSTLLDHVDGLMLSGGSDIDPAIFGETPHPTTKWVRERDDFEIALVHAALERDLPLFAICRGHQVLNVALGGRLVQDIPSQLPAAGPHRPKDVPRTHVAHHVDVLPGTRLREILGRDALAVNSFHHQAVSDLGRDLRIAARGSEDGVVEAIELPDRRFAVGVQWHPEAMWNQTPDHQELFRAFVQASSRVS